MPFAAPETFCGRDRRTRRHRERAPAILVAAREECQLADDVRGERAVEALLPRLRTRQAQVVVRVGHGVEVLPALVRARRRSCRGRRTRAGRRSRDRRARSGRPSTATIPANAGDRRLGVWSHRMDAVAFVPAAESDVPVILTLDQGPGRLREAHEPRVGDRSRPATQGCSGHAGSPRSFSRAWRKRPLALRCSSTTSRRSSASLGCISKTSFVVPAWRGRGVGGACSRISRGWRSRGVVAGWNGPCWTGTSRRFAFTRVSALFRCPTGASAG